VIRCKQEGLIPVSEHPSNPVSKERATIQADTRGRLPIAYTTTILLFIGTSLAILLLRVYSVSQNYIWSATGGLEGAGALGIFNACSGEVIYHDFSGTTVGFIFNFLFYEFYGFILKVFGSCYLTPLIGRGISLVFLVALAACLMHWFRHKIGLFERISLVSLVISPMVGWWAISLRPDVGGMMFFAVSVLALLAYLERSTILNLSAAALFVFLAWSFKQTFIFIAPLITLFILTRSFKHATLFVAILGLGLIATLLLMPSSYLTHTVYLPGEHPFLFSIGMRNAVSFLIKASGLLAGAALLICLLPRSRLAEPRNVFLLSAFAFSVAVFGVAAAKVGAADNYFFPSFALLIIFLMQNVSHVVARRRQTVLSVVAILTITSNAVLLSGVRGRTSLDMSPKMEILAAKQALMQTPGPKLIWGELIARPWITPQAETRILDGYIDFYQTKPIPGVLDIAGRVGSGYYATVAIPVTEARNFDLSGYELKGQFGATRLWIRKGSPAK